MTPVIRVVVALWISRFPKSVETIGLSTARNGTEHASDFCVARIRPQQVTSWQLDTRSLLERSLAQHGLNLTVTLECHQLTTIGQCVAAGLGVSAVPAICRQQMLELGAVCLPLSRPKIRKPIGCITRTDRQLSTAVHTLRSVVEEILRDQITAR